MQTTRGSGTLRTVIIDDAPEDRRSVRRSLERSCGNIEIVGEAESADTGTVLLRDSRPDLLILDIDMPVRTGFELLDGYPDRAFDVILLASDDHHALRAVKYHPVDYLVKPVDPGELKEAVGRAAEARSVSGLREAGLAHRASPSDRDP